MLKENFIIRTTFILYKSTSIYISSIFLNLICYADFVDRGISRNQNTFAFVHFICRILLYQKNLTNIIEGGLKQYLVLMQTSSKQAVSPFALSDSLRVATPGKEQLRAERFHFFLAFPSCCIIIKTTMAMIAALSRN